MLVAVARIPTRQCRYPSRCASGRGASSSPDGWVSSAPSSTPRRCSVKCLLVVFVRTERSELPAAVHAEDVAGDSARQRYPWSQSTRHRPKGFIARNKANYWGFTVEVHGFTG